MDKLEILEGRKQQVFEKNNDSESFDIKCETTSLSGSVSQRACVFCGSRVVLYPVADALHVVHGPIGCAAYTWDIRGAVSSGPELHRLSFSTDLKEMDVIYGGEKKLYASLGELIDQYRPKAAFIYSTCIIGLIGDDIDAVCKKVSEEKGLPVLPVHSEGFKGTKKDGYKAACEALMKIVGTGSTEGVGKYSINILGEFNLAGEAWIIKDYYEQMGIEVVSTMTGDGRVDDIRRSHGASLNIVQCSGSMVRLAKMMEEKYGIPRTSVLRICRKRSMMLRLISTTILQFWKLQKKLLAVRWENFIRSFWNSETRSAGKKPRSMSEERSRRFRLSRPWPR